MSQPTTRDPQTVLEYATPDADGLPDWIPEAEAMIDRRRPPNAIRRYFRNAKQAVRYFGKSMARRYGAESLGERCISCGAEAPRLVLKIEWIAQAQPRFLEFHISESSATATFPTLHPLCSTCLIDWLRRLNSFGRARRWLAWIKWTMVIVLLVPILLQIIPLVRSTMGHWLPRPLGWGVIAVSFLSVAMIDGVLYFLWWLRRPEALKRMMPRSVALNRPVGLFERDGRTLRSLTE